MPHAMLECLIHISPTVKLSLGIGSFLVCLSMLVFHSLYLTCAIRFDNICRPTNVTQPRRYLVIKFQLPLVLLQLASTKSITLSASFLWPKLPKSSISHTASQPPDQHPLKTSAKLTATVLASINSTCLMMTNLPSLFYNVLMILVSQLVF